jgi:hypothetical protein
MSIKPFVAFAIGHIEILSWPEPLKQRVPECLVFLILQMYHTAVFRGDQRKIIEEFGL